MPEPKVWPALPPDLVDDQKAHEAWASAIAEAVVDAEKTVRGVGAARAKSEDDLNQKLADTLTTLTVGGIDRARTGAQFIQTAATAIAGLYTGVLAVLFVADQAAPIRSFIPVLFLGLAVVLATYYLAFVVPGTGIARPAYENNNDADVWVRLNYVSLWVRRIVFRRAGALRAAVICLFFGLLFLPIGVAHLPPDLDIQGLPAPEPAKQSDVIWPAPTILPDASLSVALYTAQLAEFRDNLPGKSSGTPDTTARDELAAWVAALLALVVVGYFWWDPFGHWRPVLNPQQVNVESTR